jgi:hypothetical protein
VHGGVALFNTGGNIPPAAGGGGGGGGAPDDRIALAMKGQEEQSSRIPPKSMASELAPLQARALPCRVRQSSARVCVCVRRHIPVERSV